MAQDQAVNKHDGETIPPPHRQQRIGRQLSPIAALPPRHQRPKAAVMIPHIRDAL